MVLKGLAEDFFFSQTPDKQWKVEMKEKEKNEWQGGSIWIPVKIVVVVILLLRINLR